MSDIFEEPDEHDLEKLRALSRKADLIHELILQIAEVVSKFVCRDDITSLSNDDQISIPHSAFMSLMYHYGFDKIHPIGYVSPENVVRAHEIVKLEEQLNKEKENDRNKQQ